MRNVFVNSYIFGVSLALTLGYIIFFTFKNRKDVAAKKRAKLRKRLYFLQRYDKFTKEEKTCRICQNLILPQHYVTCKKPYHRTCLVRWQNETRTFCPCCIED